MKRNILKYGISLTICLLIIMLNITTIKAMPYYDVKFEKASENVVKGNYEKIEENVFEEKDKETKVKINKNYKITSNIELNQDELDAINQAIGLRVGEDIKINKEEKINTKINEESYIVVRPVYKEIKGIIVKDYKSWENKKDIIIKIPIDCEYNMKNN